MRSYLLGPRPANQNANGEDYSIYEGEPIVMDLHFPPAATLNGRIVDESGRPLPGVRIRLASCDYLDTKTKESHHNHREFWSIRLAPSAVTSTRSDSDGRFRFEGVPKEAGFWILVEHADYASLGTYAATTDRPSTAFEYPAQSIGYGQVRPPVETGALNVTMRANRTIAIQTVFAGTEEAAPQVRVSLSRGSVGSSASGTSDAGGKLLLRLPPGEYDLCADPTAGGADCLRTLSTLKVATDPSEQSHVVRVNPGAVVVLEAVDANTGSGIAGVQFLYDLSDHSERGMVQSRPGYIDNPSSDANGQLRAIVVPGDILFSLRYIPESTGYGPQDLQARVTLAPGKTVTVRFELKK
jgi:hypothetical protein